MEQSRRLPCKGLCIILHLLGEARRHACRYLQSVFPSEEALPGYEARHAGVRTSPPLHCSTELQASADLHASSSRALKPVRTLSFARGPLSVPCGSGIGFIWQTVLLLSCLPQL